LLAREAAGDIPRIIGRALARSDVTIATVCGGSLILGMAGLLEGRPAVRMRDITKMKIVLKGILTPEGVELPVDNGIDGTHVSNHGGRGEDNGRSTIDTLPEIIAAVNGRMPVIVDSGFRRGTDDLRQTLPLDAANQGLEPHNHLSVDFAPVG